LKALVALPAALLLCSCGYHVSGHSDLLPKTIHTIAIPAFNNSTTRYKLTDRLPEALSREFIARTRYKIVSDPNQADVVLRGTVTNYLAGATIVVQNATAVDIHVYLQVSLVERATGKVLFSRPAMEVRERYEVSVDPSQYFEESDAALDRVSRAVAQQLVTSILENF
jgi:outer membrane lipopolysaccharide assembly protein LptE/RlpB